MPTSGIIPTYPHFVQTALTVRLRLVWNQSEGPAALEEWTESVVIARYRFAGFGLQPLLLYLFCTLGMGLATSL
jgi:hypothetical protein